MSQKTDLRRASTQIAAREVNRVATELARAVELHGDQSYIPLLSPYIGLHRYRDEANSYKARLRHFKTEGMEWSWDIILLEEVFEMLEAVENGDLVEAREEAVQVLAMVHRVIEKIDSELGAPVPSVP